MPLEDEEWLETIEIFLSDASRHLRKGHLKQGQVYVEIALKQVQDLRRYSLDYQEDYVQVIKLE